MTQINPKHLRRIREAFSSFYVRLLVGDKDGLTNDVFIARLTKF